MKPIVDKMKIATEFPIGCRVRVFDGELLIVEGIVDRHDIIGERICVRDAMQLRWWEWLGGRRTRATRID